MPDTYNSQRRLRRRESFENVAELYASARPGYPDSLVSDLVRMSRAANVQRVLEIGPGTGQLTVPLAEAGFSVLAVELGEHLAQILQRKLEVWANAIVCVADFDRWSTAERSYDLVVAATAFHWLDASTRMSKCAGLLRPGGSLAIVHAHWGAGASHDPFALESQSCYSRWDPEYDSTYRPPGPDDLPERNAELENSGLFGSVIHKRYIAERSFSAKQYCDLLRTFSNVCALTEEERSGFLACIGELIRTRFGGTVARQDVYDLWFATAA